MALAFGESRNSQSSEADFDHVNRTSDFTLICILYENVQATRVVKLSAEELY